MLAMATTSSASVSAAPSATAQQLRATDCLPDVTRWMSITRILSWLNCSKLQRNADPSNAFGDLRMRIEELIERRKPGRKVQGIAAALLPYDRYGQIAVDAFQQHLKATQRAGLMNAVNMDTG